MNFHLEFSKAFEGSPWHGKSSLEIIEASHPDKVFTHWIPNAHSISEIVVHLTVWTEEAQERLRGKEAKTPVRGDWPVVKEMDSEGWTKIVEDFKSAHQKLKDSLERFDYVDWQSKVLDSREETDEVGCSYDELTNGIIQHLAYHSGQISLLQKF